MELEEYEEKIKPHGLILKEELLFNIFLEWTLGLKDFHLLFLYDYLFGNVFSSILAQVHIVL